MIEKVVRMRWMVVPMLAAFAVAGCSKTASDGGGNTATGNFTPPTTTSRADFGGRIERKFHKLDKNGDDKLEQSELPERVQRRFAQLDSDGNGSVSSEEWGAFMLKRFDRRDANRDGSVASDEARGNRKGRRNRDAGSDMDADANMIE